jgi:hypothetical protein
VNVVVLVKLTVVFFFSVAYAMLMTWVDKPRARLRAQASLVSGVGWFVFVIALVERNVGLLAVSGISLAGAWVVKESA